MTEPSSVFRLPSSKSPRVAIAHDWLIGGGAEKVVLELHRMFPDAPIYTSYATNEWRAKLDGKVVTGYLQHWPFSALRKFLPVLRGHWFRMLDLSDFGLVISSSGNGEAKFVQVKKPGIHISYCHTPTHFYWRHYEAYLQNPGFGFKPLVRLALKVFINPLRKKDYQAAQKVDYFIANSSRIQADIKNYYQRDSIVIYPPVDIERFALASGNHERKGFVTMGRQVPQKKTDIVVMACTKLGLPLTVIGRGSQHDKLVALAGPTIVFKTDVADDQMPSELAGAEAFIFAAEDDFGIAPVEAMAAGTPVIAYRAGGALDYVVPGKTGQFFNQQTVASLVNTLEAFNASSFSNTYISKSAERFSHEEFQAALQKCINNIKG